MRSLSPIATALAAALSLASLCSGCSKEPASQKPATTKVTIRVGHFPNITHAQGLLGHYYSDQAAKGRIAKGWFEERLGNDVEIQWFTFNAGPTAMERIFADALDMTYVGPSPTLNAYGKSQGEEIRILAGATLGGAGLIVQGDGRIKEAADFRNKKVATPQLGNTQDVACRAWLMDQGFKVTQQGGDVQVVPTNNPDILTLFISRDIDAAWTVEPWLSRIETEGNGKLYFEENDTLTTILVSSVKFLREHAEVARKFVDAHAELTRWMAEHTSEAQELVKVALGQETRSEISPQLVGQAWKRLRFTSSFDRGWLDRYVAAAKKVGFLTELPDLSRLLEAVR